MKKLGILLLAPALLYGCPAQHTEEEALPQVYTLGDELSYCESVLVDNDRILVANFGSEEFNPLNNEGKGYIVEYTDSTSRVLVPANGHLNAPKGMLIKDNHLFVADVGQIAVFRLKDPEGEPMIIPVPEENGFVNDLATVGNTLYVTVTCSGNIYELDITDPPVIDATALKLYTNVPGANGILAHNTSLYIASYPTDGETKAENVIYKIDELQNPTPVKLNDRVGQYDGLAAGADGNRLYFTNWENNEVGYFNLDTQEVVLLEVPDDICGPAALAIRGGKLYIPDLPNSRVVVLNQPEDF